MKKIIVMLLTMMSTMMVFAKYDPAIIILRNGEKIECFVDDLPGKKSLLSYRLSPKDKTLKIDKSLVEFVSFIDVESNGQYTVDYYNLREVGIINSSKGKIEKGDRSWERLIGVTEDFNFYKRVYTVQTGTMVSTVILYSIQRKGDDYCCVFGGNSLAMHNPGLKVLKRYIPECDLLSKVESGDIKLIYPVQIENLVKEIEQWFENK